MVGNYCGSDGIGSTYPDNLYTCTSGTITAVKSCANGCVTAAKGSADYCA